MVFVTWPRIILQLGRKRWRVLQCTILAELDLNLACEGIWSSSELAWEPRHSPLVCDYVHIPKCTNVHFMLAGFNCPVSQKSLPFLGNLYHFASLPGSMVTLLFARPFMSSFRPFMSSFYHA